MVQENDWRVRINKIFGDEPDKSDGSNMTEMHLKIMPELIKAAVLTGSNSTETTDLNFAALLISMRAIGISTRGWLNKLPVVSLEEDIKLQKIMIAEDKYYLTINVNPNRANSITSNDDRGDAVERVRAVMLEALESYRELDREHKFVPMFRDQP